MIKERYGIKDFYPLIGLFVLVVVISGGMVWRAGGGGMPFMQMFMAWFFLLFGFLKLINLKAFAEAYGMYDIVAKRSRAYAYLYPFIEFGLGLAYLFSFNLHYTNIITLIVMLVSALGVYLQLRKGEQIICACLGVVFKVPMTWVTLFEDLLMAAMAVVMLLTLF